MVKITPLKKVDASKFSRAVREAIYDVPHFPIFAKKAESQSYTAAKMRKRITQGSYLQLVAKNKNEVVGICFGSCYAGTCYLEWIGISRKYRRQGIAKKLIKTFEEAARQKKVHKIWLNTDIDNKASVASFRSSGYRRIAVVKKHWYGTDNILWEKLISSKVYGR